MDDYKTNRFLTDEDRRMVAEFRESGPDKWDSYDGASAADRRAGRDA